MANPYDVPGHAPGSLPVGPSEEEWRAMTPEARERFLVEVNDSTSDPRNILGEGRPHKKAKTRIVDLLGLHFKAMGRVVYVAEDMSVVYPGEEVFTPDVLAVLDVVQPEDDERLAWVVADEGRGIDLAFEVLHRGNRCKDLVDNVARYARLGVSEYFVYDRARQHVHGYRLPTKGAAYSPIVPQSGRYTSSVLGLDMAIQGGSLRFFQGMAELFGSDDLIGRLERMVEALEARADEAAARADEAATRADEATATSRDAVTAMQAAILSLLAARGVACADDVQRRITGCDDIPTLQRWLVVAGGAASSAEIVR